MFGAEFSERTRLVELSEGGFSLILYRPLTRGIRLTVNLHPDVPESAHCVKVITTKVDTHFDSTQTVHVRAVEIPQAATAGRG